MKLIVLDRQSQRNRKSLGRRERTTAAQSKVPVHTEKPGRRVTELPVFSELSRCRFTESRSLPSAANRTGQSDLSGRSLLVIYSLLNALCKETWCVCNAFLLLKILLQGMKMKTKRSPRSCTEKELFSMQTTYKEGKTEISLNHERSFLSRTAIYHVHVRLVLSKCLPN